jgi:anti-sigma regulatory factor (Ser/Thr protein kinase)
MFEATFTADDEAPASARAFVRSTLNERACTKGAVLAVSELVTNVVVHDVVSTELTVSVEVWEGSVRLQVVGNGPNAGSIAALPNWPEPDETTGRGLSIVDAIAERWGVVADESPAVWCELAC